MLTSVILIVVFVGVLLTVRRVRFLQYRIDDNEIRIMLFGRVQVARIPLHEIDSITSETWLELLLDGTLLRSEHCGSLFLAPPAVLWRKDRRPFLITLPDRDLFVETVSKHLQKRRAETPTSGSEAVASDKEQAAQRRLLADHGPVRESGDALLRDPGDRSKAS